ncbi:MAG TPA: hypothetical protein VNU68_34990 [Verrucomicrobiae bacterium]|nr:hypothetical protein [Verrucomicrobiae bacterium]
MPLTGWTKTLFWDPRTGEDAITYSGYSGHGTYWVTAPLAPAGKSRRAQKDEILDRIEEAIERNDPPGEVK